MSKPITLLIILFMRNISSLLIILFCLFDVVAKAAQIDTVLIHSQAMNRDIPIIVVTPEGYQQGQQFYPAVYLLHGYSGNYTDWTSKAPNVTELADQHQLLLVCPDGGFNSWYFDSPIDPASQYETHVSEEIVRYVDEHYRTIPENKGRAITGLSMGGHGALFLAIRHQDIFGAAGSMSGGVNLTFDINAWEIELKLGRYEENPLRWDSLSVINILDSIQRDSLAMIIDCGVDDFFIEINRRLHHELLQKDIPHDYIERPGAHNWHYWRNAIKYQLLFFRTYFDEHLPQENQEAGKTTSSVQQPAAGVFTSKP